MNVYGTWWDDTITLYNKYSDSATHRDTWYRTIIQNCFYDHETAKVTVGTSVIQSDNSLCRIRIDDRFVDKRTWDELSEDEKSNHFTLAIGDIIVAGEVDDSIDDYAKDKRSSDLVKKYKSWPGCFSIESVRINVGGGRGNEHYFARGV